MRINLMFVARIQILRGWHLNFHRAWRTAAVCALCRKQGLGLDFGKEKKKML